MSVTPQQPPTAAAVFVSEPIDLASGPGRPGYQIVRALSDLGFTCFRPATAWGGGAFNPALVESTNRQVLFGSNAIIADLSEPIRSFGVPMEIEAATTRGIPAVVLVDPTRPRSVSLQANARVQFAETVQDAVALANRAAQTHWAHSGRGIESNTLKFVMADGCQPPKQGLADDAGVDLTTAVDTEIPPHSFRDIPTTVLGVQVPEGTWALITGRSSAIRKRGLLVPNGIIDHGWRGPLMAGVYNLTDQPVLVLTGERVAQVILMPNTTEQAEIVKVDRLDPHERGLNGFGSTGGVDNGGVITTNMPPLLGFTNPDHYQWDVPPLDATPAELPAAVHGLLRGMAGRGKVVPPDRMVLTERDELESLRETVAILSDPDTMADLAEAETDIAAGRLTTMGEPRHG